MRVILIIMKSFGMLFNLQLMHSQLEITVNFYGASSSLMTKPQWTGNEKRRMLSTFQRCQHIIIYGMMWHKLWVIICRRLSQALEHAFDEWKAKKRVFAIKRKKSLRNLMRWKSVESDEVKWKVDFSVSQYVRLRAFLAHHAHSSILSKPKPTV